MLQEVKWGLLCSPSTQKKINLLACALSLVFVVVAIIMEVFFELKPCAICLVERVLFVMLSIMFFVSFLTFAHKRAYLFFHFVAGCLSLAGMVTAISQSYFQFYPVPFSACGIPFEHVIKHLPAVGIVKHILNNPYDCQEIGFKLFGLSLPMWTIFCFLFFLIISLCLVASKLGDKKREEKTI